MPVNDIVRYIKVENERERERKKEREREREVFLKQLGIKILHGTQLYTDM